jgi:glutamine synthetase
MTQDLRNCPQPGRRPSTPSPPREEIRRIFPPDLIDNMLATKRQELHYMAELSEDERRELYLDTV